MVLNLERDLLWVDIIVGRSYSLAEGAVLVFRGYSPAVHAAEEVDGLDQSMRVTSVRNQLSRGLN